MEWKTIMMYNNFEQHFIYSTIVAKRCHPLQFEPIALVTRADPARVSWQ